MVMNAPAPAVAMTAMSRKTLSAPARWLKERGLLGGLVLDYGSGRGEDAKILDCPQWDPYWYPRRPTMQFHRVLCTYVLNVLPEEEHEGVILDVKTLMRVGGLGFLTVRRDLPKEGQMGKVFQSYVTLDLPVLFENRGFCIYVLNKER